MIVEEVIKKHLDKHLKAPSFFEFEEHMPDEFVMVERIGGGRNDKLPNARFAIQSYSNTLFEAALLNQEVKNVMDLITEQNEVSGVRLVSDYNFTDIETRKYRYQAVYEIYHY